MTRAPGRARQVVVSDPLWEIFSTMAEETGNRVDDLVNLSMFEMAVRLGYVNPVSRDMSPPMEEPEMAALSAKANRSASPPAADKRYPTNRVPKESSKVPPPAPPSASAAPSKRPPRPVPRQASGKIEDKGLYIVKEDGSMDKIDKDIFIIGRSSKSDLVINSVKVSREHAIITKERGDHYIEDLGSANGTWYKGEKIEKMKLGDGDEIFICDEKFKFIVR